MADADLSWSFGTLLRRYRSAAGLTQEELAERAGVSVRRLGDLERGVPHRPRRDTVALLARALGLSPQDNATFVDASRRLAPSGPATAPSVASRADPAMPPFVGRASELALLERHIMGQGPPLLAIAGEPGMGKTRLLHAAIPRALLHGLHVLEGGCQRRGGQAPFAPLLGALQGHIGSRRSAQLRTDLTGCAWLVRLLPELADGPIEALPTWTLSPAHERRLMGAAVARFLGNVAGPQGTLLVLDDLQWADPDALDLLATLVRSAMEIPLRVVGAYRQTDVRPPDPLSVMLADLAHAGLATQRQLRPLAPTETTQLVAGLLEGCDDEDGALRAALVERTGGVPFYVVSCAQGLRVTTVGQERGAAVPWDVAQSIRQRVAALPGPAREALGVAAVVGRVVPYALLSAACSLPTAELAAALHAACGSRLLEERGADAYQFAHDVIREVIEADLGAAHRLLLHGRTAEALERAGPARTDVEALAYHYSRSAKQDKAVLYLEQAGDHARDQYAHAAALGYYGEAVERLDRLGHALAAARVREKLGGVLLTAGQYDQALEALEPAAEAYRTAGDLDGQGQVLLTIALTHTARGTPEEPVERVQKLLVALEERGTERGVASLCLALANLYFHPPGRVAEHLAVTERAVAYARRLGDERLLAVAYQERGSALFKASRWEEALPALEEAAGRAEAAGDLAGVCWCFQTAAGIRGDRGEVERQRAHSDRAVATAERLGDPLVLMAMTAVRGNLAFFHGDWAQTRADCARSLAVSRAVDSWLDLPPATVQHLRSVLADEAGPTSQASSCARPAAAAMPVLYLGQLCLTEGDLLAAAHHLEDATALAVQHHDIQATQSLLAQLDLVRGRPADAYARLVPLTAYPEPWEWWEWPVTPLRVLLAWAHLELGEEAPAAARAEQAIARARAVPTYRALVEALWMQARVATRQGRWAEARRALDEGVALAQCIQAPYAEGRLLHAYGRLHAGCGEGGSAQACWEAALTIFRRLGARADAREVERTRGALGPM